MASSTAHTTGSIAAFLADKLRARGGARLLGRGELPITHIESLERAGAGALTYVRSRDFLRGWEHCRASAVLAPVGLLDDALRGSREIIEVQDADEALNLILDLLAPPEPRPAPGVHPTALVDPTASLGAGVSIGPFCIIGPGCVIGDGTALAARVTLGREVRLGRLCTLHVNVTIYDRCTAGDGCVFKAGAVIGSTGFGYRPSPDGRGVVPVPHTGNVEIGHGVDVGANACIDRAKWGSTIIADGSKIDNLVQVAHGCRVGRVVLMAAQVGLAGSADVGDGVMLGGQAGVADNISVGAGTMVAAQAGVTRNIGAKQRVFGIPARPVREVFEEQATLRKIAGEYRERRQRGKGPPSGRGDDDERS